MTRSICSTDSHQSIGFEVLTTSSPRNFDYVKSLGVSQVFDYNSPSCGTDIRKATDDKLYYAWDAIGEANAGKICAEALSSTPANGPNGQAKYVSILGNKFPRDDVFTKNTLMYTTFGESFEKWGRKFPASKEDLEYMKVFVAASEPLVANGTIKPHKVQVRDGGLDGILGGLNDMKEGKINAVKLVYKISNPE
jgi:NADPH:quinone reductase-like Zn-dependent oxidoreductase